MAGRRLAGVLRFLRHRVNPEGDSGPTDGQLLQRFVTQGDEGAFAALLQQHGPLVLGVCRQVLGNEHDAEDAFQATFLVLARKAASIRKQQSVAAWLHRVAFNIARTARTSAARRQAHERQAAPVSPANPVDEVVLRDWQPLLHEEVDRLPAKYRAPVVLCYLQGKTNEEAARELGWRVGTVQGRLAAARDLLRPRLAGRGLALPTGIFAAEGTQALATAAVPAALAGSTIRAVILVAAGKAVASEVVSARAVALTDGALRTLFLAR